VPKPIDVFPDDDGGFSLILDGPSYPSRQFAEAVATNIGVVA